MPVGHCTNGFETKNEQLGNQNKFYQLSGYHADTPITIKAEAIHEADSRIH